MSVANAPPTLPGPLYRMSLELYHRIADLGLLTPRDRVVLLDGLLVSKARKTPRHATSAEMSLQALKAIVPAGWHVRKDAPVTLPGGPTGASSEPEPDLSIVRGTLRDYPERHPSPAECALFVEVADISLADDRYALRR